ncbi:hypothetical protein TL16_g01730 [Triparma laevis f. inornata]|uniref:AB hydrolase-1 domain-containing protein n=1 Tax=Triparma laevis f. inornata TaxID=1714386 RepID=A0A9W6ZMH2_9STRA|nr:hypothetical protein TL16_g01730 [Triparma laevis f. inornata]
MVILYAILFITFVTLRTTLYPPKNVNSSKTKAGSKTIKTSLKKGTFTTRDNIKIQYYIYGDGPLHLLCGNGLGCSPDFAFPIMTSINESSFNSCTLVTWDYRGLFNSKENCENITDPFFSIRDSALDAKELMDHLGWEKCHSYFGYSTGVQVGLELATMYPHLIDRLVLLNGAHGQLLHSLLQPIFRIPLLGDFFHVLLILILRYKRLWKPLRNLVLSISTILRVCVFKPIGYLTARHYEYYCTNYFLDFFNYGIEHSVNYMKYPHMLDCHSSFHLLHTITQKTLIITGMLDMLTPAYHSYEMHSLMPNSTLLCKTLGTHFVLLEYPEEVGGAIVEFVEEGNEKLLQAKTKKAKTSRSRSRSRK